MAPIVVVRATMILSTVAWALGEALMRRSVELDRIARLAWTAGIGLALAHIALAFQLVYGWNHAAAVAATAQQTINRFGWGWGGGIYLNYAFVALWLADVCWWWVAPRGHASRPLGFERVRLAFFAFMFLNGAVIFASGIGRLFGIASLLLVLVASPLRKRSMVYA